MPRRMRTSLAGTPFSRKSTMARPVMKGSLPGSAASGWLPIRSITMSVIGVRQLCTSDILRVLHPPSTFCLSHSIAIAMLWDKQKVDGGWSTRRMSDVHNWRTPMTDIVIDLIGSQPDAADPGSDPFMTGLAIVLLRENGVPASDVRIRRGIAWLKGEQRVSGRWWMQSLYRGNYQFSTY